MRRTRTLAVLAALVMVRVSPASASESVVIGSKNFAENRLLAEMFARLLEAHTDLRVERRFDLAGTQICLEALRGGDIDLYPEYTGTGLVSILGEPADGDPARTRARVGRAFKARWNLVWLDPLGFENAYEIAVAAEIAQREGLRTLSELARVSRGLRAGFGFEFMEREDGLPGLERAYGLRFREAAGMQQNLKYQAARDRKIDVLDVYTTDGRLISHRLTVLEDDRGFFPPYEASALVRGELLDRHPEAASVLRLLSGRLDEDTMRRLNARIEEAGEPFDLVAQDALETLGLIDSREPAAVSSRTSGFPAYFWAVRGEIGRRTLEHLGLSALALCLGVLLAVPLGMLLERRRGLAESIIRGVGMTQTVPSLALLAFMVPLLGIGSVPAIAALWIYSIYPILRNTYTGIRDAGPEAVAAARALGMTEGQLMRFIRLPLAAPVILAGVRTAAALTVGTATLAAFIGAGGLGVPIVSGLQMADSKIILSGAIPAAALALLVDALLSRVEVRLTPRGLEPRR